MGIVFSSTLLITYEFSPHLDQLTFCFLLLYVIFSHADLLSPLLSSLNTKAVCYLNNHGKDYKGGILRFQDGEPSCVVPVAGDVVIYTADSRNVHCVDEVHFFFLCGSAAFMYAYSPIVVLIIIFSTFISIL